MGRSAKTPSRTALLQRLGEEALALFHSGALPVPAKLRDTVTALEAVRTGTARQPAEGTRRERSKK